MAENRGVKEPEKLIEGTVLESQIQKCDELMGDIVTPRLDPNDEEDIYNKIDFHFGRAKEDTYELLGNRFRSVGLNNALKTVIHGIIEEQGFDHKLARRGQKDDDLKRTTWWLKLYAGVVLDKHPKISYEEYLIEFKQYRDEIIEHPSETIPSASYQPEGSLLGFLTLTWSAMEDLIRLWGEILSQSSEDLEDRQEKLRGEDPKHGFIHKINDYEGFVTTYPEGQAGQATYFDLRSINNFPKEGDIVCLEDYQDTYKSGDPRKNLTANWVRRYDLCE